ncbi:DUF2911 domain-containing protein [Poritiphilus flavus]|uniref:DUF2911 domain-containing protein n=1 Tax=Poritiphilus flavus TaxID=2697053 RepID=A0A6L9EEC5_9FLAO|nr:DUF2911 domain-containing protein [Poritiphilus flavus]NAS13100.1 DUF2911 domain-containing protein [Poritiphilus flavus]
MRKLYQKSPALLLLATLLFSVQSFAQLDLPRGSQMAKVSQRIGITDVTIVYSRPSVNDREIWGKLVPYGMNNLGFGTAKESPWRAGANENTVIKFTDDVKIEGQALSAGKYGLHMVIEEGDKATVIFSKNHGAWGSYFYEPSEDALRVDVSMKDIPHVEQLTFAFNEVDATSAVASLNWEKKQIPFKVEVDVTDIVLADIRQKLQDTPGFSRQSWEQAANFALNNDGDLDEALGWVDAAIAGQFFSQKTFNNLGIKARILTKQGKNADADALMDEAMGMGTVFQIHGYGRQLIGQGEKEKAMAVFKKNAKMNKGQWPVDFGLARGYSAMGDYKTALKHLKIAEGRAPDALNQNAIAGFLVKLENGEDIN